MLKQIIYTYPLETEIHEHDKNGNLLCVRNSSDKELESNTSSQSEYYLSPSDLSSKTGLALQTIYNLIHKKVLIEGIHYFRPTQKKLLFKWSTITGWIEKQDNRQLSPLAVEKKKFAKKSSINI